MRIIVDLVHPADVNFYKNAIKIIQSRGDEIILTVRSRGILVSILERELNIPINIIGRHYPSLITKVFGTLKRDIDLLSFMINTKADISTSFSPHPCRASKLLGLPSIIFDDDYIYRLTFNLQKLFATRLIIPDLIPAYGHNIFKYSGFKELAYLHPKYFNGNINTLDEYGLKKQEYIFIREIAGVSLDYKNAVTDLVRITEELAREGLKIVLSLEDKSRKRLFCNDCIILEEPVGDIYSLLKYSALTISGGDTMAREATLLGTPSIYTGGRRLPVDEELIKDKCMYKVDVLEDVLRIAKNIIKNEDKNRISSLITNRIENDWEDTTEVILKHLYDFKQ